MISLFDLAVIGIFVLSLEITFLIYLKFGRPSNWFAEKKQ